MAEYVDVIVSEKDSYRDGLIEGKPAAVLRLLDDSNSAAGIPNDWNTPPDFTFQSKGCLVVVATNAEIDVYIGYGSGETPALEQSIPVRPAASGVASYTFIAKPGENHIWVRRAGTT